VRRDTEPRVLIQPPAMHLHRGLSLGNLDEQRAIEFRHSAADYPAPPARPAGYDLRLAQPQPAE
jgi:hypothetical protein